MAVACEPTSENEREAIVSVLADRWMQRWRLTYNGVNEQLLFEDGDIVRKIRDEFQKKFWNIRGKLIRLLLRQRVSTFSKF